MAIKISIVNNKGGVGKTSCALNIADALTHLGYKVLFLDIDPQHNSTSTYGAETEGVKTMTDVLLMECSPKEAVQHTPMGDIIASSMKLAESETKIQQIVVSELNLKNSIAGMDRVYDFIIMDTPPNLGLYLTNALCASDGAIIVIKAEQYAVDGLSQIITTVNNIKARANKKLKIYGVLLNMYDSRNALDRDIKEILPAVGEQKGFNTFDTVIRISQDVKKVQSLRDKRGKDGERIITNRSLFDNYPESNAAIDSVNLVKELLNKEFAAKDSKKKGRKK